MKKVLSIAGSDCSGGAGIQADLKTFAALNIYGMSVIVSVVAENTVTVLDRQDISPKIIKMQMDAVFSDIEVDAVKIGMLPSLDCVNAVRESLDLYKPKNIIIDPVMYAKSGYPLMDESLITNYIKTIIPKADLLTPNIPEAERIAGLKIESSIDTHIALEEILKLGCKAALIKGGHSKGSPIDTLYDGKEFSYFESNRINTKNTHGTGCTLSSAIAAFLAKGESLKIAVKKAREYIQLAIENSLEIGHGHGPLNHLYNLYKKGESV